MGLLRFRVSGKSSIQMIKYIAVLILLIGINDVEFNGHVAEARPEASVVGILGVAKNVVDAMNEAVKLASGSNSAETGKVRKTFQAVGTGSETSDGKPEGQPQKEREQQKPAHPAAEQKPQDQLEKSASMSGEFDGAELFAKPPLPGVIAGKASVVEAATATASTMKALGEVMNTFITSPALAGNPSFRLFFTRLMEKIQEGKNVSTVAQELNLEFWDGPTPPNSEPPAVSGRMLNLDAPKERRPQ